MTWPFRIPFERRDSSETNSPESCRRYGVEKRVGAIGAARVALERANVRRKVAFVVR